jgi:hypothetical protein
MGAQEAPGQAQTFASVSEHRYLQTCTYSSQIDGIRFFDDLMLMHIYTDAPSLHPSLPDLATARANTKDFFDNAYPKPCQVVAEEEQLGYTDRVFCGLRVLSSDNRSFHTFLGSKNQLIAPESVPGFEHKLVNTIKSYNSFTRSDSAKHTIVLGMIHRAFQCASSPPLVIPGLVSVLTETSLADYPHQVVMTQIQTVNRQYQFPIVTHWITNIFPQGIMKHTSAKANRKPGCRPPLPYPPPPAAAPHIFTSSAIRWWWWWCIPAKPDK